MRNFNGNSFQRCGAAAWNARSPRVESILPLGGSNKMPEYYADGMLFVSFVTCYRVEVLLAPVSRRDMQKLKKIVNDHWHFRVCCFVGNLVGAIVNNMKDHLKPTSKKLYIYSAVSNTFLCSFFIFALFTMIFRPQFTLTSYLKWPNVWVSIFLINA